MKRALFAAALLPLALWTGRAAVPRVKRAALAAMEKSLDGRLERIGAEDSFALLGNTRGIYLEGYGAVFTAEVNLLEGPVITPFRQIIPKEDIARLHTRKLERLPVLKRKMRELLSDAAASLDTVPDAEQVAVGVTLFHFSWEDVSGLPRQVLMHAQKKRLLDRSVPPESYVQVVEF